MKEINLKISEEQNDKNILIINTADTPEKVIDINNSILNLNYQKNIKNIKILNKIGNLDKDKLINKYEFQFSNVIYGVEFQIIEFMFNSKPHYAYQVTNKFDYPLTILRIYLRLEIIYFILIGFLKNWKKQL